MASGATQCFHLDGSLVTDPGVVPCVGRTSNNNNGASTASMCCNLGRQSSRIKARQDLSADDGLTENAAGQQQLFFSGPDICLANGLCQLQLADAQTGRTATPVQFSRDSCTSPDWEGGCLSNVCSSVTGDNAALTPCGSSGNSVAGVPQVVAANQTTQWCCGSAGSSSTASCCALWPNHPDAVFVPLSFGASSSSSSSSSSSLTGATGGNDADPPRGGPFGPSNPVSISIGPGGVVTLVTITTGASLGQTTSSLSASRTFVGSLPVTNSVSASTSTASSAAVSATAAAVSAASSDTSNNGETVITGATGLNTQEVAGIVAGLVVVVVVLVSVGCFTAESMYKKRQQRFRARQLDEAMKQTYPVGAKSRPLM
ncbi:hypothetical protein SBRCBS47491_005317 [Sporothrix bragantina]|uniref:Transmembrane protein n=1 Tax=Sporothrix bragantina TaxID=671064 RepID=A0ABP0BVY8_9PEZI